MSKRAQSKRSEKERAIKDSAKAKREAERAKENDRFSRFTARRVERPHIAQEFEQNGLVSYLPEVTERLLPWAAEAAVGCSPAEFYHRHGLELSTGSYAGPEQAVSLGG